MMGHSESGTDAYDTRNCDACGRDQSEHPATVADFYLDTFEVTVARFRRFVEQYDGTPLTPGSGAHPACATAAGRRHGTWCSRPQVDVEVERSAEALHVGDAGIADLSRWRAERAGTLALPAEDLVGEDLVEPRERGRHRREEGAALLARRTACSRRSPPTDSGQYPTFLPCVDSARRAAGSGPRDSAPDRHLRDAGAGAVRTRAYKTSRAIIMTPVIAHLRVVKREVESRCDTFAW